MIADLAAVPEEVSHLGWWHSVKKKPPIAKNDRRRCQVVDEYHALLPDEHRIFDELCDLACKLFSVRYSAVSLVSRDIAFISGQSGGLARIFPRNMVLCNYVIKKGSTLCIPDTTDDAAFIDEPDVTVLGLRFFAAVPLTTLDGFHLGTFCVADDKPRLDFAPHLPKLEQMAGLVMREIEFRRMKSENEQLKNECAALRADSSLSCNHKLPEHDITIVCTDVESSTQLWELDRAAMDQALRTHDAILRKRINEFGGYEVCTEGDAFQAVFRCASDAIKCALGVQQSLLSADWPSSLLAHPSARPVRTESGQLVSAGLRVRIGLHTGEPVYVVKREQAVYYGPVVAIAKKVSQAAHGGQIVATDVTWRESLPHLARELGSVEVLHLGGHLLVDSADEKIAHDLVQILPASIGEASRRRFPPLRTLGQLSDSFWDAPRGRVTLAVHYIEKGEELAQADVALLQQALAAVTAVQRKSLTSYRGYECGPDPSSFMASFADPVEALRWCLRVQADLLLVTWSGEILSHPACAPVRCNSELLFSGPRLQMGLYTLDGVTSLQPDPTSGKARYFGQICNRSARVAAAAHGGQVLVGGPDAYGSIVAALRCVPEPIGLRPLGFFSLKGIEEPIALAEAEASALRRRFPAPKAAALPPERA